MPLTVTQARVQEGRSAARELMRAVDQLRTAANLRYTAEAKVTTTLTAAATVLWDSADMPGASVWEVEVRVLAYATDGSAASYARVGTFKRATGTSSQVGATRTLYTDNEDVAAWDVTLAANANGVRLTVAGSATRTIDWSTLILVRELA